MNPFKYSDEQISEREFMIALPSIIIGVSILSLPNTVAKVTKYSDGWVPILIAGIIFTIFAVLAAKLALSFPNKSFLAYTSELITKPVAIGIVLILILIYIWQTASIVRQLSFISQQYIFNETPREVLAFTFLLVVVYAVSGSRAGLFRLNVLFLPIILIVTLLVTLFNIGFYEFENARPLFKTSFSGYIKGISGTFEAYTGFGIALYYISLIKKPKNIPKKVIIGISIPVIYYLLVFMSCLLVFGNEVTKNLLYPTIELAKRVDIPGGTFERIDAVVFTVWIMTIFTTTMMLYDIAVLLLSSLMERANKRMITFILAPIIYYVAMFIRKFEQATKVSTFVTHVTVYCLFTIILVLFLIAKFRGVTKSAKK